MIEPIRQSQPRPGPRYQPSIHDGLAITAFIMAWFFPPIGFILSCVSISSAHKNDRLASGLAVWGAILSVLAIVIWIIVLVNLSKTAAPVCDLSNPNFPNC